MESTTFIPQKDKPPKEALAKPILSYLKTFDF